MRTATTSSLLLMYNLTGRSVSTTLRQPDSAFSVAPRRCRRARSTVREGWVVPNGSRLQPRLRRVQRHRSGCASSASSARVPRDSAISSKAMVASCIRRSQRLHGHVHAVFTAMKRLCFERLIGSRPSRQRNLVVAMVASYILRSQSKLATTRWWHTMSLDFARDARCHRCRRGRALRRDGLAARATRRHREEAGRSPSQRRRHGAVRPELELFRGSDVPALFNRQMQLGVAIFETKIGLRWGTIAMARRARCKSTTAS